MRRVSPRNVPRNKQSAASPLDSPQIGRRNPGRARSDSGMAVESRADKVKKSLQMQRDQGLISEEVYHEMLKSSMGVMTVAEGREMVPGGQTVRVMVGNERRQLRGGMITPEEFNSLKKQAVKASVTHKAALRAESRLMERSSDSIDSADVAELVESLGASPRTPGTPGAPRKKLPSLPTGKDPRLRTVNRSPRRSPAVSPREPSSDTEQFGTIGGALRRRKKATLHEGFGDLPALPETGKLACKVVEFTETRNKSRFKPAFVVQVVSQERNLRYRVTRFYRQFYMAQQSLLDEFPELPLHLKSPADLKSEGKTKNASLKESVNAFLGVCCTKEEVARSFPFVTLINPKTSPTLSAISKAPLGLQGWVERRKPSALVSHWHRFYAVLFKSTLYFFASREPNAVSSARIELEFCEVDLLEDNVISFMLYTIGNDNPLIRLRSCDEDLSMGVTWYKAVRAAMSEQMHAKYIPLLSVEEANKFEEKLRSLSSVGSSSSVVLASCSRRFYQKDRPDTIAFTLQGTLKGGTPEKLVEKMLDTQLAPMGTVRAFLLTYQSFLQSGRLLDQLMSYYERPPEKKDSKKRSKDNPEALTGVQLRVLVIMQRWLEVNPRDFIDEPALASSLKAFFEGVSNEAMRQKMLSALQRHLVRGGGHMPKSLPSPSPKKQQQRSQGPQLLFEEPSQHSAFPNVRRVTVQKPEGADKGRRGAKKSKEIAAAAKRMLSPSSSAQQGASSLPALFPECGWDLMSIPVPIVAQQITLLDHQVYCSINPRELLYQAWNKADSKELEAPHVLRFIDRFNILSGIVTTCVCRVRDLHTRASVVARWLDVATELEELQNFSGLMSVVAGLRNAGVNRLRKTWALVGKLWDKQAAAFERHQETVNAGSNFKNLRARLLGCGGPAVPYLGITLTDLVFHDEGNPDHFASPTSTAPPLVNFEKRLRYAQVIGDVLIYQNATYKFQEIPEIQQYLLRIRPISDEQCYQLSMRAEPRTKK